MDSKDKRGLLVVIGGHEDKEGDCVILREVVTLTGGEKARLVVLTAASDLPAEVGEQYLDVFHRLGVKDVQVVDVSTREDALVTQAVEAVKSATGLYFTGGDQVHVTSLIGGSPLYRILKQRFADGLLIAGTSAGAAMMSNTMVLGGEAESSPSLECIRMGAGLDLLPGTIVDTHFAQRGRFGRLLAAAAHAPHNVGLGIDEDTAMVVENGRFRVLGSGAITVIDAGELSFTNVPDLKEGDVMALFDVRVHIMPSGYEFDLDERRPIPQTLQAELKANEGKRKQKKEPSHAGQ